MNADVLTPTALELMLHVLRPWLARPGVTELCINAPGGLFLESANGWSFEANDRITLAWCHRFARLVAHFSHQRIDESAPLLSAALPGGERVQIVLPPATSADVVVIAIRRPSQSRWTIADLAAQGIFQCASVRPARERGERLVALLRTGRFEEFMREAVRLRQNVLVSGPTGSGKTTWTKALIREIPREERLITIEDASELTLDEHPNHVRLFYSKDAQGSSRVTPKQLLECSLRLKPDRILLAELRAEEAFDYLRAVNSGHPGSITSVHATSAPLAFEQMVLLVKQSRAGADLSREDIRALLDLLIDVVIQFDIIEHRRVISEIWYRPLHGAAAPRVAAMAV